MNRMPEIAKMLGLEVGEEFNIKGCIDDLRFQFTEEDVGYFYHGTWVSMSCFLGDILKGKYEIVKLLLTKKEKEYLSMVIKPFRDKIEYIQKLSFDSMDLIQIRTAKGNLSLLCVGTGLTYKEMEWNRKYTIKELGL